MKPSRLDKILSYLAWAIIIGWTLAIIVIDVEADTNQTTSSGSNTAIEGGYTSTTTNNYSAATAVDQSSTSNSTSNVKSAPPTASAPPLSNGIDTCALSMTAGLQTFNFGVSHGHTYTDENYERIKLARELATVHNMRVAGISVLCQSKEVWIAMWQASTYCPININGVSLIGEQARNVYLRFPILRPDYEEWVAQQKAIQEIKDQETQYTVAR